MNKWIAEFELEDGDTMPEHMDLNYKGSNIDFHCKPAGSAILIPDGATNGYVIKALFSNASIYEHGSTYSVNNEYNFNSTWWNAPYKKLVSDECVTGG